MSCRKGTFATVTGIGALLFGGLGIQTASAQTHSSSSHIFALSGDYEGAHDPSVIKAGDTWYVFTTGLAPLGHMAIRCSKDLQVWKLCGQVLREIPKWIRMESPGTRELWAPDISYFNGADSGRCGQVIPEDVGTKNGAMWAAITPRCGQDLGVHHNGCPHGVIGAHMEWNGCSHAA